MLWGNQHFLLKKERDCRLTSNHDLAGNRERPYLLGSEIEAIISFKYCLHKSCYMKSRHIFPHPLLSLKREVEPY